MLQFIHIRLTRKLTDTLFDSLSHRCLALLHLDAVLVAYRYDVEIIDAFEEVL